MYRHRRDYYVSHLERTVIARKLTNHSKRDIPTIKTVAISPLLFYVYRKLLDRYYSTL